MPQLYKIVRNIFSNEVQDSVWAVETEYEWGLALKEQLPSCS